MCSGSPRRASSAAWRRGCSVFTRPPRISSCPVKSATSVTSRPASRNALGVPPVERISTPCAASVLANSATPVLSETEISAGRTRIAPLLTTSDRVSAGASLIDDDRTRVVHIDPNCASRDHADRLRIEFVLNGVDRLLQPRPVTPCRDRHLAPHDRRSPVDSLVAEMDRPPRRLHSPPERLADRAEAGAGGE